MIPIPVVVEPLPGVSTREVLRALEEAGAVDVVELAEGFISADVDPEKLAELELVAEVTRKARKQPRDPG